MPGLVDRVGPHSVERVVDIAPVQAHGLQAATAVLSAPGTTQLADQLGLSTTASRPHYDTVIVGAGPAGLAAGVYAASEGLSTSSSTPTPPAGKPEPPASSRTTSGFRPVCRAET